MGRPARAHLASRRIAACLLDFIPVVVYVGVLLALGMWGRAAWPALRHIMNPNVVDAVAFLSLVAPVIAWFACQEAGRNRATRGKRAMGLAVVTVSGGRVRLPRSLLRSSLKFLPWQVAHTCVIHLWFGGTSDLYMAGSVLAQCLAAIYLAGLLMPGHRTLYDILSATRVVQAT